MTCLFVFTVTFVSVCLFCVFLPLFVTVNSPVCFAHYFGVFNVCLFVCRFSVGLPVVVFFSRFLFISLSYFLFILFFFFLFISRFRFSYIFRSFPLSFPPSFFPPTVLSSFIVTFLPFLHYWFPFSFSSFWLVYLLIVISLSLSSLMSRCPPSFITVILFPFFLCFCIITLDVSLSLLLRLFLLFFLPLFHHFIPLIESSSRAWKKEKKKTPFPDPTKFPEK